MEITVPWMKFKQTQMNRFRIQLMNRILEKENQRLMKAVYNHPMQASINDVWQDTALYSFIPASVVSNSAFNQNNCFIIDKGSLHGIETDMGVVSPEGVAGIVKEVSPHFSIAVSFLHSQFRIFAQTGESGMAGIALWDGKDYRFGQITNLPTVEGLKISDTVVTSQTLIFPENYPIGTIHSLENEILGGYSCLKIKLLTPFNRLRNVYVVKLNFRPELQHLIRTYEEKESL
jgi:rod shape-determining protein MreC